MDDATLDVREEKEAKIYTDYFYTSTTVSILNFQTNGIKEISQIRK